MRLFVFGPRVTCTIYSTAFMPNAIIMHTWHINVFLPRPEFSLQNADSELSSTRAFKLPNKHEAAASAVLWLVRLQCSIRRCCISRHPALCPGAAKQTMRSMESEVG